MSNRISTFVKLPMDELDRLALQRRIDEISASEEAPTGA